MCPATDPDAYMEANRRQWEVWTPLKAGSVFYDLDGFRRGGVRIRDLERTEVGDVAGRSLLHLQSHVGIDTLSWARLGAHATGVDFSHEGVTLARSLAAELELPAKGGRAGAAAPLRLLRADRAAVFRVREPLRRAGGHGDQRRVRVGARPGRHLCALVEAGLRIEFLHEWPFVAWRMFPFLELGDDGWWHLPAELPSVPLSFSLRAGKPTR